MNVEIWKKIDGFPGYEISNLGRVRCFRNFNGKITNKYRILNPIINKDDYYYVDLYHDRKQVHKRIHRLVLDSFVGPRPDLVANHINGDKHDNRLENLEWVTAKENSTIAARKQSLYKTKPLRIIETGEVFRSIRECAEAINYPAPDISNCLSGNKYSIQGLHFESISLNEYNLIKGRLNKSSFLYPHQWQAIDRMFNGCILNGGVGSGKSRTGLYYYFKEQGGSIDPDYIPMKNPKDLYILTTAKKRNDLEWDGELSHFLMSRHSNLNYYKNKIIVDSWQNIKKYENVTGAFFLFDEDKVTGKGAWAKAFLKITKSNDWIILSATSGDRWEDYETVFIANGFFRNRTEMRNDHYIYNRFAKFPMVDGYRNEGRLIRLRNKLLIDMDFERKSVPHHEDVYVRYNVSKYKDVFRTRWDIYKNEPIQQAAGLCYVLRRVVNEDESRQVALLELFEKHHRMIVFYNFDYEREILRNLYYGENVQIAEYSGHAHDVIPDCDNWVYLVQYTAGCEGFNCIRTDTIVFYSQNYSYKVMVQAAGRIDRLNSPYKDLYYYHLKSRSGIDLAISKALSQKKKFNEGKFVKW